MEARGADYHSQAKLAEHNAAIRMGQKSNRPKIDTLTFVVLVILTYIFEIFIGFAVSSFGSLNLAIGVVIVVVALTVISYIELWHESVGKMWVYVFAIFFNITISQVLGLFGSIIGVWGFLAAPIITYLVLSAKGLV